MDEKKELFNFAATIFHLLFSSGETNVCKFIIKYGFEKLGKDSSFVDIYNIKLDVIKYKGEILNGDYLNSILFLLKLDNESADNAILIEYIKNQKRSNCSLCDGNDVLIFPTFHSLDHYYYGYENLSSIFNNLYFIDTSIFGNSEFIVNNFYFDFNQYENQLEVAFVPYPYDEKIHEEAKNGLLLEKEGLESAQQLFIERIEKAIKRFTNPNNIPSLVFTPEIVGSRLLDEKIKLIARNNKALIGILCPSYHKRTGDKTFNEATLFVNEDRTSYPCAIRKFVQASISNTIEQINTDRINITIINVRNIGKVMFIICRDFLSDVFSKIAKMILPDFVVVQCFTPRLKHFDTDLRCICKYNSCVMIGNSCSAIKKSNFGDSILMYGFKNDCINKEDINVIYSNKKIDSGCIDNCLNNKDCSIILRINVTESTRVSHPTNILTIEKEEF